MHHKDALPLREFSTAERVQAIMSDITELRMGQEPVVKLAIVPGVLQNDRGEHAGKPSFYFFRPQGDRVGYGCEEGSFLHMAQVVLGENSLCLRADSSTTPEQLRERAETLKAKLESPLIQRKIRELYAQMKGFRNDLLGY